MKSKITQSKCTLFKGLLFRTFIFTLLFLCNDNVFSQTIHGITDPDQLEGLTLAAGDTVILADNTYPNEDRITFSGIGTAAAPITFKAATPGGVIFTGGMPMNISGDYLIVDGFHWKGGNGASNFIQFRDGYDFANHSTIQNCVIDGLGVDEAELLEGLEPSDPEDSPAIVKHRWIVLYGTYNTVINCSLMNKVSAGVMVLAEYEYNAWGPPYNEPEDGEPDNGYQIINTRCNQVGHTISNNYFYNFEKMNEVYAAWGTDLSNAGDSETIRIGTSEYQNVNSGAKVSNNYFVSADGENEIITNKSKGNTYANNTFRRCRGSLVLRHGSNAIVNGNYFLGEDEEGTGGIRISDSNHTITNNYIQDCITVASQAKWNNGITFIGGGDSNAVACSSTSLSNGYQKTEDIILSNNTIMNTNAPLFYNVNTDNNSDVKGTVSNNLIYFEDNTAPRHSEVISGDTPTSYGDIGVTLTYTSNVYKGTTLGETNAGFSEETGITATADGEIFTFLGATGKGADMGSYVPTTNAMVGNDGVGACFVDNLGASISNPTCNSIVIVPGESLTVAPLSTLTYVAASYDVSVTANISWTATPDYDWITINPNSGTGDATVSVTVTENTDSNSRTGMVTFTGQGVDDIEKILTITQEAPDLTDLYNLINTGTGMPSDKVTVHSFSKEQGPNHPNPKTNYASNTLDKDNGTVWPADDLDPILPGDFKGDGEYVIYDLGNEYELDLIQIATDDKSDPYGLQVWVSTTGTNPLNFTMVLPTTGDLLITTTTGTSDDFDQYEITETARYVKLIGFGRFNGAGDSRKSIWTNISEIEFYGTSTLSVDDNLKNKLLVYPNPAKNSIQIGNLNPTITSLNIYSIQGRKVLEKPLTNPKSNIEIDISSLVNGLYILNIIDKNGPQTSKKIVILN